MTTEPCTCWSTTSDLLAERGMKIHAGCTGFSIGPEGLKARHYLPLQRSDGGKPRSAQAKGIAITHCPFCGTELPKIERKHCENCNHRLLDSV
jgi:hypothetical protein